MERNWKRKKTRRKDTKKREKRTFIGKVECVFWSSERLIGIFLLVFIWQIDATTLQQNYTFAGVKKKTTTKNWWLVEICSCWMWIQWIFTYGVRSNVTLMLLQTVRVIANTYYWFIAYIFDIYSHPMCFISKVFFHSFFSFFLLIISKAFSRAYTCTAKDTRHRISNVAHFVRF